MNMYIAKMTDQKWMKKVLAAAVFAAVLGVGHYAYQWYQEQQGYAAQRLLGDCLDEYHKAQYDDTSWPDVQMMSELAHTMRGNTSLAPFFLAIQAQAQAKQGDIQQAVTLMEQAVAGLPSDSPYRSLYAISAALIALDAENKELQEKGIADLNVLAQDEHNIYRDSALYHLGEWYMFNDDIEQAKQYWHALTQQSAQFEDSPWLARAQERLSAL